MNIIDKLYFYSYFALTRGVKLSGSLKTEKREAALHTLARTFFIASSMIWLMDLFRYLNILEDNNPNVDFSLPIIFIICLMLFGYLYKNKHGVKVVNYFEERGGNSKVAIIFLGWAYYITPIVLLLLYPWLKPKLDGIGMKL